MEVTAGFEQGSAPAHESDERARHSHTHPGMGRRVGHCSFVCLTVVPLALTAFSTSASAHGGTGHGGTPVTFAVVVGFPVVVGLVAGVTTVTLRRQTDVDQTDHYSTAALGLVILFLGGTFTIEAATRSRWLALAGATVGGMVALGVTAHNEAQQRNDVCHTELTCGAISLHRALEGLAIGAIYSTGAVVGVLGATTIAGHTVLETAAVGGQYSSFRLEAIGAIGLVQLSYAVGAIVGIGLTAMIPVSIQSVSLAVGGGILFAIGANETRHSDVVSRAARLT